MIVIDQRYAIVTLFGVFLYSSCGDGRDLLIRTEFRLLGPIVGRLGVRPLIGDTTFAALRSPEPA